jgi:primosomal protein N' (replication factor Y)
VRLADWLTDYYFASPSSVWQTMLPAGLTKKRRALKKPPPEFKLPKPEHELTVEQQAALEQIRNSHQTVHLLQGVTSSGKTRIYADLAAASLQAGKSVIILVPEIALTPQLMALFEANFPGRVLPYHSAMTEAQRHAAWLQALQSTEPLVAVGPRSALFLPFSSIGLVVVDECHETSYKQEQNPRYQAVTVAAKLGGLTGAQVVLGSATPGLWETFLAEQGRLNLVKLTERANKLPAPSVQIVDLRDKTNLSTSRFLSLPLLKALEQTLTAGRQSLLFINRRGTASSQICGDCGHVSICPRCHLPLTFHADHLKLVCHICNYRQPPPAVCPECGSGNLRYVGGGTKRVEDEVRRLFPTARLARLDKDSADPKTLHQIHDDLHQGKIDILIGTQMIAKGLDLPMLDTIGVISADTMLHMPDFSAAERTFDLLTQVSGRAGRGDQSGRVFIQTYTPDNPAVAAAARSDFWGFARAEFQQRQLLGYPPYRYLLKLAFSHKDEAKAQAAASDLFNKLSAQSANLKLLGPAPAFYERAGGQFHWHIVVKSPVRARLLEIARTVPPTWKTDLDPVNLL